MHTQVKKDIIAHALSNPIQEVCGLVVYARDLARAIPCRNIEPEPDNAHAFEIADQDYIAATKVGIPCGLYHSHIGGSAAFTEEDLAVAEELALPSYLVVLNGTDAPHWLDYIPKSHHVDSVGADFAWGARDCYETIRIHYRQELGIYLPDYERDGSFRTAQPSIIMDYMEGGGFINMGADWTTVRPHDLLIFNTDGRRFPHHIGVFVGRSRVLHHPYGALSRIDDIDERWLDKLVCIARHKTLIK